MHEHQIANLAARLYAAHDTRWDYATCVREAIFLQEEAIEQTRVWREAHRSNPKPAGGGVITPSVAQAAGAV